MFLVNPLFGSFGFHGGPTATYSLLAGSPAIDAIPASACPNLWNAPVKTDQRGQPRPHDGDGNGTALCDIGSYEK